MASGSNLCKKVVIQSDEDLFDLFWIHFNPERSQSKVVLFMHVYM
jgi:hypothetical protein